MGDETLLTLVNESLGPLGFRPFSGVFYPLQELDVLQFSTRVVRTHWMPIVGKVLSVVVVARQPFTLPFLPERQTAWVKLVAQAVNSEFPPRPIHWGLSLAVTLIQLTAEPIQPEDDALLASNLGLLPTYRSVLMGWFRINLAQESLAFALRQSPDRLSPEVLTLADALTPHLHRFVPRLPLNLTG